jgi:hypothetical protein
MTASMRAIGKKESIMEKDTIRHLLGLNMMETGREANITG